MLEEIDMEDLVSQATKSSSFENYVSWLKKEMDDRRIGDAFNYPSVSRFLCYYYFSQLLETSRSEKKH